MADIIQTVIMAQNLLLSTQSIICTLKYLLEMGGINQEPANFLYFLSVSVFDLQVCFISYYTKAAINPLTLPKIILYLPKNILQVLEIIFLVTKINFFQVPKIIFQVTEILLLIYFFILEIVCLLMYFTIQTIVHRKADILQKVCMFIMLHDILF